MYLMWVMQAHHNRYRLLRPVLRSRRLRTNPRAPGEVALGSVTSDRHARYVTAMSASAPERARYASRFFAPRWPPAAPTLCPSANGRCGSCRRA